MQKDDSFLKYKLLSQNNLKKIDPESNSIDQMNN